MNTSRLYCAAAIATLAILGASCAKKPLAAAKTQPPVPAVVQQAPAASANTPPAPSPAPAAETAKSRYPDAATQRRIDELLARIQDAYFDYDRHSLRQDAMSTLKADAKELGDIIKEYPDYKLQVQGFCDERGSAEYNLALGEKRATTAKEYLAALGVPADQMKTLSYGKEQQVCSEHDESCWQKNRRVHILAMAH